MKCQNEEILNNERNAEKILAEDKLLLGEKNENTECKFPNEMQNKKYIL